jgi:hypothetical protein
VKQVPRTGPQRYARRVLALPVQAAAPPQVGPGAFTAVVAAHGYRITLGVSPNQAGLVYSRFVVHCARRSKPVAATVALRFTMPAMAMPSLSLRLAAVGSGVFRGRGRELTMPGRWEIVVHVSPRSSPAFDVRVVDRVSVASG